MKETKVDKINESDISDSESINEINEIEYHPKKLNTKFSFVLIQPYLTKHNNKLRKIIDIIN